MTARAPKLLLDGIRAAQAAREFLGALTFDDYLADAKTRSAVERQLEILGEACAKLAKLDPAIGILPETLKLAIGLRNRIIHGYDGVDHGIVFQTVVEDLPPLIAELSGVLKRFEAD